MSINENRFPVPYVEVDRDGAILGYSALAREIFYLPANNIIELIDEDSRGKFRNLAFQFDEVSDMELHLVTRRKLLEAFDVHVSWDAQHRGHIVFISKDEDLLKLREQLDSLQHRLATTNIELLNKKEDLEMAIQCLQELSGPYIVLTPEVALIPLFGEMTEETIYAITGRVLDRAVHERQDALIFDMTAVSTINEAGAAKLKNLFSMLELVGKAEIHIVGIKPAHARQMDTFQQEWACKFSSSIESAFRKIT